MKPILLALLLAASALAQTTSQSTPTQQNTAQQITAQPNATQSAPAENTDAEGRNDSLRTGVTETQGTAPLPLTVEQERQAQRIGTKLHCPICSGESIAQSQTDISRQMMNEVRDGIRQGKTEQQILDRFAASYSERILMEPPKKGINLVLWTLPIGALLLGIAIWQGYLRRASTSGGQVSAEDERRIAELLREREGRA